MSTHSYTVDGLPHARRHSSASQPRFAEHAPVWAWTLARGRTRADGSAAPHRSAGIATTLANGRHPYSIRQHIRAVFHRVPRTFGLAAPGLELFITDTLPMGLDNYPYQCPDASHGHTKEIPEGFIHRKDKPCPLQGFPKGILGNCCWLRGKVAAHELDALGEVALAERMYSDMTCEQATAFASELRAAADRLQAQYRDAPEKPKGAGWNGTYDKEKQDWIWKTYSTFDEALASIREAAEWFERVGRAGFGVVAWS